MATEHSSIVETVNSFAKKGYDGWDYKDLIKVLHPHDTVTVRYLAAVARKVLEGALRAALQRRPTKADWDDPQLSFGQATCDRLQDALQAELKVCESHPLRLAEIAASKKVAPKGSLKGV